MADAAGSRRVSVANGFTSDGDALIDAGRAAAREQTLSRVLHLQQPREVFTILFTGLIYAAKPSVFLDASSNFQPQLGARATISYSFMSIVMSSP